MFMHYMVHVKLCYVFVKWPVPPNPVSPHKKHSSRHHTLEGICFNRPIEILFANYKKIEVFCNLRKELRLSNLRL